jgi:hypothetical protein
MYHIFKKLCNFYLKFIVHPINFEMVEYKMVILIGRKKAGAIDADVVVY